MKEIKLSKLKEVVYYDKCDNGLDIYMWVKENANNYYATLNVKYGSVDTKFKVDNKEYNVVNGIAHFLEHINFNESDGTSASEYFDKIGTSTNAFTTFDYTAYEIYGSNDILGDVNHLIDFVQDKTITSKIVENEKGIILEEVRMDKNNPNHKMYFNVLKSIYKKNKRRNEITGIESEVSSITKKELDLVYDSFYHPSNMFIVITGNFNPYEMAAMIKENQSKKSYKDIKVKKIYEKEDFSVNKKSLELQGNVEIPKISISYKMDRKKFKNYNDLELRIYLNMILNANFGSSSDLKEELLNKCLIVALSYSVSVDKDVVVLTLSLESKYPSEIINIIKDEISKLSISDKVLQRKIKCNISDLIIGFDDIEYVNSIIQSDIIYYDKLINNRYDIYHSINIDDAKKILKSINLDNEVVVITKP